MLENRIKELEEQIDDLTEGTSTTEQLEATDMSESTPAVSETLALDVEVGSTKEAPIVITVAELVDEIDTDIDAAKEKYNGKWVQITGTVTDYSRYSGDDLSGYYLYGNTDDSGLKIICWQNKGAYKQNEKIGDVCTCTGQVREITTFNATEIGDCEIVFE